MNAVAESKPVVDCAEDERAQLEKTFRNGATWFYWVAGLSIVNSLVVLGGGEWGFIFGLGATQMVDGLALGITEQAADVAVMVGALAMALNALIAGGFVFLGWLALKGHVWAYGLGLVFYLGDALIFLAFGDFLGLAFHGWVLVGLVAGLMALRKLQALDSAPEPVPGSAAPIHPR